MSIHVEQATLAYTADELFAVVADVKDYPLFEREIIVDLTIGFGPFQENLHEQGDAGPDRDRCWCTSSICGAVAADGLHDIASARTAFTVALAGSPGSKGCVAISQLQLAKLPKPGGASGDVAGHPRCFAQVSAVCSHIDPHQEFGFVLARMKIAFRQGAGQIVRPVSVSSWSVVFGQFRWRDPSVRIARLPSTSGT